MAWMFGFSNPIMEIILIKLLVFLVTAIYFGLKFDASERPAEPVGDDR